MCTNSHTPTLPDHRLHTSFPLGAGGWLQGASWSNFTWQRSHALTSVVALRDFFERRSSTAGSATSDLREGLRATTGAPDIVAQTRQRGPTIGACFTPHRATVPRTTAAAAPPLPPDLAMPTVSPSVTLSSVCHNTLHSQVEPRHPRLFTPHIPHVRPSPPTPRSPSHPTFPPPHRARVITPPVSSLTIPPYTTTTPLHIAAQTLGAGPSTTHIRPGVASTPRGVSTKAITSTGNPR